MAMLTISIHSGLLESARDLFRCPAATGRKVFLEGCRQLFHWGRQTGVTGAAAMIEHIEQDRLNYDELLIDHTRLFVNSFPRARAHPFAGWYLGDEAFFGVQAEKMRDFYARHGLQVDHDLAWPADHIMVELEFAAIMLESFETSGDQRYLLALQELSDHLDSWMPQFIAAMREQAESDYYRNAAEILQSLLTILHSEMKGGA